MAVSYNKLWKILIDKKMKRIDLKQAASISGNVLARLSKDEYISMESMDKICKSLGCKIGDVMEFYDSDNMGDNK